MPVYKFRTLDEMRRTQRLTPEDPRLPKVIRFVWELAWAAAGRYVQPRGLFKFRAIEEANAHREAWQSERIARLRPRGKNSQGDAADVGDRR